MSEEEFVNYRSSYIQSLTKSPTNLGVAFSNTDGRITRGSYDFDNRELKAAIVEKLTKQEMLDLYQETVLFLRFYCSTSIILHTWLKVG